MVREGYPRGGSASRTVSWSRVCSSWVSLLSLEAAKITIGSSSLSLYREASQAGWFVFELELRVVTYFDSPFRYLFVQLLGFMQRTKYYGVWLLTEVLLPFFLASTPLISSSYYHLSLGRLDSNWSWLQRLYRGGRNTLEPYCECRYQEYRARAKLQSSPR